MSDGPRRLTGGERDAAIFEAKKEGGACAACGRVLSADEPVWRRRLASRQGWSSHFRSSWRLAFVGRECATPEVLADAEWGASEPCEHCGRMLHYGDERPGRRRVFCSYRCRLRAGRITGGQPS